MLEKPIAQIEFDKIYSVKFFEAKEKGEETSQFVKITFFDNEKFVKGVLDKKDPFQNSEKWIRLKMTDMDAKVVGKFKQKIEEINCEGHFLRQGV
jgi:hypothetical protein